ncbi:hypothetical protein Syun_017141 [Stephania yunnanensis]|uniref:Uncharacterized protein n=1 Tax=Stephania yunnanensis TaxID=152371 RepID=A0AAP0J6I5_9MAGN
MEWSLLGGLGGVQPVTDEPSLSQRSPTLQSKMGVWPWASMALGGKQKNSDAKERPVKKSKLGHPNLGEADVEAIGTISVYDKDIIVKGTDGSGSTGGIKACRTQSGSDPAESGEGEDCFDMSNNLADLDATSFPGGPSNLSLIPSFSHHTLLDIWRNKVIWNDTFKGAPLVHDIAFYFGLMLFMDIVEQHNPIKVLRQMGYVQRIPIKPYRPIEVDRKSVANLYNINAIVGLDVALWFRCMDMDNVTFLDACDMADSVIAFLSGADDT